MTDEYESAATEARDRGMAFLVDGRHVSADRVMILSLPDTTGPISSMRRAKVEAQTALAEVENVSKRGADEHTKNVGMHLRWIMEALGLKKEPHWDDTWLGMHSYITMVDIEAKCKEMVNDLAAFDNESQMVGARLTELCRLVELTPPMDGHAAMGDAAFAVLGLVNTKLRLQGDQLKNARAMIDQQAEQLADAHADTERIDWLDKRGQLSTSEGHMRWVIVTDSGITNVRLAMDSKGALKPFDADRRDKWKTTCSAMFEGTCEERDKLFELADAHAARQPVIVNDIVVTDPALLEPITDAAPGVTQSCGVCGAPFVAVDSLFCEAHRG